MVNRIVYCLLSQILVAAPVYAQPDQPRAFYEKNYAEAPQVGGETIKGSQVTAPRAPSSGSGKGRPEAHVQSSAAPVAADGNAASVSQPGNFRTVMRVTLYVSSKDKAHFEAVMHKALRLADGNPNARIGAIFHIGDYRNVSPTILQEAKAKKIFVMGLGQVPANLNVTSSPTWFLQNAEGEYVVEGASAIEKFIGRQGEYRVPERSMFEAPPKATVGVQGF